MVTYRVKIGEVAVCDVTCLVESRDYYAFHVDMHDKHVDPSGCSGTEIYLSEGERTILQGRHRRKEGELTRVKFDMPGKEADWMVHYSVCGYSVWVFVIKYPEYAPMKKLRYR